MMIAGHYPAGAYESSLAMSVPAADLGRAKPTARAVAQAYKRLQEHAPAAYEPAQQPAAEQAPRSRHARAVGSMVRRRPKERSCRPSSMSSR